MAVTCETAKALLLDYFIDAKARVDLVSSETYEAYLDWNVGLYADAIGHLINAQTHTYNALYYIVGNVPTYDPPYLIPYLWTECSAEVTWKSIVEAWVKDDFEGRFWTIGVIDRMRQILWNEPFDLTWAARPEEKEI